MKRINPSWHLTILICGLLFTIGSAFANTISPTDSIKNLIKNTKEDSTRILLYLKLGEYTEATDPDTSLYHFNLALTLAKENSNERLISKCYNLLALFYCHNGNYDLAIETFETELKTYENKNMFIEEAYCYINIGEVFINKGNYPVSMRWMQKSLKLFEQSSKSLDPNIALLGKKGMVRNYNSIGRVHADNGNLDLARDYFMKALNTEKQVGDKRVLAGCYNNIGISYYLQNKFSQAIEYYSKSLKMAEEIGDKQSMSERYNNIGLVYADNKNPDMAIEFYLKSYKIDEELGDKKGMAIVLGNIALIKIQLKKYKEAILFAEKSIDLAKKIGSLDEEKCGYGYLATAYDSLHDYKKTCEYLKLFKQFNDSLFNIESGKQIKEMEAVYQTEKKQKEIELLNKDKDLQQAEISKQETQKLGLVIGLLLMLVLSVVVFRSYRQKKKANALLTIQKNQIEEKNEELKQQNEEIHAQRDEIETQRDTVMFQKERIEEILSEQTSSIKYANRIQQAVLPKKEWINTLLADHFILFKPKDIVSGDFYWLSIRKNYLMVAVADCTGHGVPGAFMSMLGISYLNEIVTHDDVYQANHVLNNLREYILKSLQQKGAADDQQDGMDIAFVCINLETTFSEDGFEKIELQFAGANNSLYYIQKDNDLVEIKGDKMPVSIYRNMPDFTNHQIVLQKGDVIYLCSDGYADQFGGPKSRKFLSGKLMKLLQEHCYKSMEEQKNILTENIEMWMTGYGKTYEQTDDITILGMKL